VLVAVTKESTVVKHASLGCMAGKKGKSRYGNFSLAGGPV